MKTFEEIITNQKTPSTKFPTFSQAISGELEEAFTGKDKVSAAYEKLHSLQLQLQKTVKDLLGLRDQYLGAEPDSADRAKLKPALIELSKKKADLEKAIKNAEIETQRAVSSDNMEIEDLDLF